MRWKRRLCLFRWLFDETAPAVSASIVDVGKRCFCPSLWFSSTSTVLYLCLAPRIESGLDSVSRWLSTAATIALCGGSVRIKRKQIFEEIPRTTSSSESSSEYTGYFDGLSDGPILGSSDEMFLGIFIGKFRGNEPSEYTEGHVPRNIPRNMSLGIFRGTCPSVYSEEHVPRYGRERAGVDIRMVQVFSQVFHL
ncbi:hypothetical protein DY000_02037916 [Brassica cretica]|uniref:Uncharacterized protein n=1 Tax=Brassica cretica TaxID=69181 RepID=A0ABQ7BMD2_BRACR|nr:hypothetical protein DY000_02037916 [Brassica cretica]